MHRLPKLADQTAFDSHSNQDKHQMHNTLCSDTTLQTTDGLSDSVIILNDISSFEPNDNNIKQARNPCKELNVDALLTQPGGHSYDGHYSIQRSNELHQSSPNIRQPIPTRITLRSQSKKNVKAPFWKNKKRNEIQRNMVATSCTKRQIGESFRTQTRWRDRMKFFQYFYQIISLKTDVVI